MCFCVLSLFINEDLAVVFVGGKRVRRRGLICFTLLGSERCVREGEGLRRQVWGAAVLLTGLHHSNLLIPNTRSGACLFCFFFCITSRESRCEASRLLFWSICTSVPARPGPACTLCMCRERERGEKPLAQANGRRAYYCHKRTPSCR